MQLDILWDIKNTPMVELGQVALSIAFLTLFIKLVLDHFYDSEFSTECKRDL